MISLVDLPEVHNLSYYLTVFGYFGIFFFFATVDQLTPIPEEISLLTIGYFSSQGVFNPFIAGAVALTAFLVVDTAYFFIMKTTKKWSEKFREKMNRSLLKGMKDKFRNNFPKTLLVLCFIPRMRLWAPIGSSVMGIPYRKFIRWDALGLSLFTSVYLALGFIFNKGLHRLTAKIENLQHIIFFGALFIIGVVILIFVIKRRRNPKEEGEVNEFS
jgi:membrane protein DedA with SNARE-associated domain